MGKYFANDYCELYHGDCLETMAGFSDSSFDLVLTSPPYNNSRSANKIESRRKHQSRYDVYIDSMPTDKYVEWTVSLFCEFDRLLCDNRIVLYNFCWGTDYQNIGKNELDVWVKTLNGVVTKTPFHLTDIFCWKKTWALPNNVSSNGATRIWEPIMVFCRKDECNTYYSNKKISGKSVRGQNFYKSFFNFIEAINNDGSCDLNKATYSSDLCYKLLEIYCPRNGIVFDPFNGTGTTGVACKKFGSKYVGVELSEEQLKYSKDRISAPVQLNIL